MIIPEIVEKSYLFCHTNNTIYIRKLDKLGTHYPFKQALSNEKGFHTYLLSSHVIKVEEKEYSYLATINNQGDFDLSKIKINHYPTLEKRFDSLLSYSFIENNYFIAGTDNLAIFNHFYFLDKQSFLCSNNLFLIAKIIEAEISQEAIFETLFFRFPKAERTFFRGINCLKPFQQLKFVPEEGLLLSKLISYNDLVFENKNDILDDIDLYFNTLKLNSISEHLNYLSFSGGSDSMCILSMLLNKNIEFKLASFEGHNEWDTERIKRLAKQLQLDLIQINAKDYTDDSEYLKYTIITNGYSTSHHFYNFYKNLPRFANIFDGYNNLFGDWSDAFLYPPSVDALKRIKIENILEKYFSGFDTDFVRAMQDYLNEYHNDTFVDANTEIGLDYVKSHAINFIPSKILSGIYICSDNFFQNNFSFQLTRKFLSFLHYNRDGIRKTFSARNDYPGALVKKPLSSIVKELDQTIYRTNMDHGISFKDMNGPGIWIKYKIFLNKLNKKICSYNNKFKSNKSIRLKNFYPAGEFDFCIKDELNGYALNSLKVISDVRQCMKNLEL